MQTAFTGLTLIPIGALTFPFPGTDQKYRVAYDLRLTNATNVPATLDRLDVVDGTDTSNVIGSFSGAALVDPNCSYGNCDRLWVLTARDEYTTLRRPGNPRPSTTRQRRSTFRSEHLG